MINKDGTVDSDVELSKEAFIGCTYGIEAVLFYFLRALKLVSKLYKYEDFRTVVQQTLQKIMKVMKKRFGYLPYNWDVGVAQIHFSHGSPATIPMLCQAIDVFPEMTEDLLECAQMAAELAWNKGLKKNIYGSIIANGYLIHCLARKYKQLQEEQKYLKIGCDHEIDKCNEVI